MKFLVFFGFFLLEAHASNLPEAVPPMLDGERFFFLHMAKTAGGSLIAEIQKHFSQFGQQNLKLISTEGCLGCALKDGGYDHYLTILRAPRAHAISQFFFMKKSGGWCQLDPAEASVNASSTCVKDSRGNDVCGRCCGNFPVVDEQTEAFAEWVDWFAGSGWAPGYGHYRAAPPSGSKQSLASSPRVGNYYGSCYTPSNMQARALVCPLGDPPTLTSHDGGGSSSEREGMGAPPSGGVAVAVTAALETRTRPLNTPPQKTSRRKNSKPRARSQETIDLANMFLLVLQRCKLELETVPRTPFLNSSLLSSSLGAANAAAGIAAATPASSSFGKTVSYAPTNTDNLIELLHLKATPLSSRGSGIDLSYGEGGSELSCGVRCSEEELSGGTSRGAAACVVACLKKLSEEPGRLSPKCAKQVRGFNSTGSVRFGGDARVGMRLYDACASDGSHRAHSKLEVAPPLSFAEARLALLSWVGVTELFKESLCLFVYRLRLGQRARNKRLGQGQGKQQQQQQQEEQEGELPLLPKDCVCPANGKTALQAPPRARKPRRPSNTKVEKGKAAAEAAAAAATRAGVGMDGDSVAAVGGTTAAEAAEAAASPSLGTHLGRLLRTEQRGEKALTRLRGSRNGGRGVSSSDLLDLLSASFPQPTATKAASSSSSSSASSLPLLKLDTSTVQAKEAATATSTSTSSPLLLGRDPPLRHQRGGARKGDAASKGVLKAKSKKGRSRHASGAGPSLESRLPGDVVAKIDQLTAVDQAIYASGVRRLVRELRQLERAVNAPVLCKGSLEALRNRTFYVRGLWEEAATTDKSRKVDENGRETGDCAGNGLGVGSLSCEVGVVYQRRLGEYLQSGL